MERNSESTLFIQSMIAIASVVLMGSLSLAIVSNIFAPKPVPQQIGLKTQAK